MAEEKTIAYNIELIVEDGNGFPSANSYVDIAFADKYAMERNYDTWLEADEYVRKAAIIKAMDYVDNIFEWKGRRKYRDQPLRFPRVEIKDRDGFCYDGEIPMQLKKAICEAAFYVFESYTLYVENGMTGTPKKLRDEANGVLEDVQYFTYKEFFGDDAKIDYTSKYQSLDAMLKDLIIQKGQSRICHRVHWR